MQISMIKKFGNHKMRLVMITTSIVAILVIGGLLGFLIIKLSPKELVQASIILDNQVRIGSDISLKMIPMGSIWNVKKGKLEYHVNGNGLNIKDKVSMSINEKNIIEFNVPSDDLVLGDYSLDANINLDGMNYEYSGFFEIVDEIIDLKSGDAGDQGSSSVTTTSRMINRVSTTVSPLVTTTSLNINLANMNLEFYDPKKSVGLDGFKLEAYCDSVVNSDKCYLTSAYMKNETEFCYSVASVRHRDSCLISMVMEKKDVNCRTISDKMLREICELKSSFP
jgi:hypothetical protein